MKTQQFTLTFPFNFADFNFSISKSFFRFFVGVIFLLMISLLIFYLFQIQNLIKDNYLIKIEQEKIESLSEQGLILEKEYVKLFALKNIEEEIKSLDLVKVSEIRYLSFPGEHLTQKNH